MNSAFPVRHDYVREPLPLPYCPSPRHNASAAKGDVEAFNPTKHLALGLPDVVYALDFVTKFENALPPQPPGNAANPLAFTSAFSVLSPEGVRACREVRSKNMHLRMSSARIAHSYRPLAYVSKFIRDLNESPEMLNHLSKIAGARLVPHYHHSNYAHMNLSEVPVPGQTPPPVDSWHVDSVQFVLVTILSDMEGMIGGEFQAVKRRGRQAALQLVVDTKNNIQEEDLIRVSYAKQGFGIFMQGCDVLHRVTGVSWAKEPRHTLINSYMLANVFAVDRTVQSFFITNDPEVWTEIARGRAWRAKHQLEHLLEAPYNADRMALSEHLRYVALELQYAATVLADPDRTADVGYFDEKTGKVESNASSRRSKL